MGTSGGRNHYGWVILLGTQISSLPISISISTPLLGHSGFVNEPISVGQISHPEAQSSWRRRWKRPNLSQWVGRWVGRREGLLVYQWRIHIGLDWIWLDSPERRQRQRVPVDYKLMPRQAQTGGFFFFFFAMSQIGFSFFLYLFLSLFVYFLENKGVGHRIID